MNPALMCDILSAFMAEFIIGPLKSGMIEQSIAAAAANDIVKDDDGKRTPAYAIAGASACVTTFFIIMLSIRMV